VAYFVTIRNQGRTSTTGIAVYKTAYINLNWQVCLRVPEEERVYRCQLLDEYSWLFKIGGDSEVRPCYTTSRGKMNIRYCLKLEEKVKCAHVIQPHVVK
jgi:hypothetical protein